MLHPQVLVTFRSISAEADYEPAKVISLKHREKNRLTLHKTLENVPWVTIYIKQAQ